MISSEVSSYLSSDWKRNSRRQHDVLSFITFNAQHVHQIFQLKGEYDEREKDERENSWIGTYALVFVGRERKREKEKEKERVGK